MRTRTLTRSTVLVALVVLPCVLLACRPHRRNGEAEAAPAPRNAPSLPGAAHTSLPASPLLLAFAPLPVAPPLVSARAAFVCGDDLDALRGAIPPQSADAADLTTVKGAPRYCLAIVDVSSDANVRPRTFELTLSSHGMPTFHRRLDATCGTPCRLVALEATDADAVSVAAVAKN